MILSNLIKQQSFLLKKSTNLPFLQSFNKTPLLTHKNKNWFSSNQFQNQDQIQQENQITQPAPQLHWLEKNLPAKYLPYVRLGRYEKPIGYKLLFWPCVWGAALGQSILNPLALAHLFGTFYFGSAVMRAAGCIVNDMWDRDFDNKVERTKVRPLASGELTMKQASIFLFLHLCGGLLTLTQLNWFSIALSFGIVPIAALYPLFKRFTYYPQVVLGSCFNWGVMVGYAAAADMVNYHVAVPAYLGGVLWTLIYDTIYAHQDKVDDIKVGVKSTALAWGENTKNVMYGLWASQLSLFLYAGLSGGLGLPYFPCCFASHLYLFRLIQDFNMDDPKTCWNFFVFNKNFGLLMFLSILIGKIFPKAIEDEDEDDEIEEGKQGKNQNMAQKQ